MGLILRNREQQIRFEHVGRGDDIHVKRVFFAVALLHHFADDWGCEVEIAQFLQWADPHAGRAVVGFPNQFGTIDFFVGPSVDEVVIAPHEFLDHLIDPIEIDALRALEPFDDIAPAETALDPLVEGRFGDWLNGFVNEGFVSGKEINAHMGEIGLGRGGDGFRLSRLGAMENDVPVAESACIGTTGEDSQTGR